MRRDEDESWQIGAPSLARAHADDAAFVVVREEVEQAIRSLADVADALVQATQIALLLDDLLVLEPHTHERTGTHASR